MVMVCGRGMLRLGDDSHAVEALSYSATEEGGWCGGRKWPAQCSEVRALCCSNSGGKGVGGVRLAAMWREGWMGGPVGGHVEGRCRWRDTHLVGDGHDPGAVAPGRAWERQGNREKGESRGGW
jgi:hypothetical protein